jgi:gamma-polyglutamate biosynthesis protein CapA
MLAALALLATNVEPTVTLVAVGDILLDRSVQRKIEQYGTLYPFAQVRSVLRGADIAFGNLECPLTTTDFTVSKRYRFRASPWYAPMLKNAGFDVLNLANNHMMDCGGKGLNDTMDALREARIQWCGVAETRFPASITVNKIRVAFLGFTDYTDRQGTFPSVQDASEGFVRWYTKMHKNEKTLVVVSFHWGDELSAKVSPRQRSLALAAAQGGADLILGHHPHVLQPVTTIKVGRRKVLVAYSLGNFVFDAPAGDQRKSAILRCTLTKKGVTTAELLPVKNEGYRPVPRGRARTVRL